MCNVRLFIDCRATLFGCLEVVQQDARDQRCMILGSSPTGNFFKYDFLDGYNALGSLNLRQFDLQLIPYNLIEPFNSKL